MALSAADKLKNLKKVAPTKEKAPAKNEIRVIDFTGTPTQESVAKLCELAYLGNQFDPIITQHKNAVQEALFERWTQEMWDSKRLPNNFKARIKKMDGDKPTTFDDMALNFILKFRSDCLKTKLPRVSDLPDGKTVHEVLSETLCSLGLSKDNAHKFTQEEFEVVESTGLPDGGLDAMLAAAEGTDLHIVGEFLMSCLTAESMKEMGKLKPLTDAQRALAIQQSQVYKVKDGVEERILGYVESLDQLRKLLNFMNVTKQVSNFEFGISDEVKERNKRLTEIAGKYINLTK